MQNLIIAGREFSSRLFLGTGKFRSNQEMQQAIETSGTEMVTLAMKRVEMGDANGHTGCCGETSRAQGARAQ